MSAERAIPKLNESYDAVVIGAGNGGLAAALMLAVKGAKPLLLEQHNLPGGFATSFVRGRFEFEASLHELSSIGSPSRKGNVRSFLEDEAKVDIDWMPVPEAYRLVLTDDKIDVRLPFGEDAYIEAIERAVPGSRAALKEYIGLCRDVTEALGFIGKISRKLDAKRLADIIQDIPGSLKEAVSMPQKLANFLKTVSYTVDEVIKTMDVPKNAVKILSPYWCYLGIPMSRLSFTLWAAMVIDYLDYGAYIPRMRSHELASAMEARILELGGRVEYNTRVERILVENRTVTGVVTSAGDVIKTNTVVSNASPTLVYNKLITPEGEVPAAAYKTVNARKHGPSAFVVYLGLDASPEELGLTDYGYFISNNMDTDDIYFSTEKAALTNMQATICLNNANPYCSPPGTSIVSMTTLYRPEAWYSVEPKDYVNLKNSIADGMISQFENGLNVGIRDHIEEIEVATPVTFARYTRSYNGGIYGYEPEPWDSIIPRVLSLKDESYHKGLIFAGGYGQFAHGYSSSLISGRAAGLAALNQGVK